MFRKSVIWMMAFVLLAPVAAMAGMTAFAGMDELSSHELAATTAQAGITMTMTGQIVTGGYIAWGDDDGCTTTVNATNQGWLTLASIWSTGGVSTMTIDVCSNTMGDQWLVITAPVMLINRGIRAIKVGSTRNSDDSLGELQISNVLVADLTIHVRGH